MLSAFRVLASDRYLEKGMGLMALTGHRPAEIFFSAKFSLPRKKLPYPAVIFDGQLKTRNAPGTSFEPYPIPVLADPKKIIRALVLSLFPPLITPLPLANSVLCSPLVPIASNSGYEHGRSSPSVDPVHQGNQRFRTPDGNETRRQLHDAEHVAPR
jgi:hypothetical protein